MRPITGADILDFYASRSDILVLTADGEYAHLDNSDIASSSYDDVRATAYNFVTTTDGTNVQVLVERNTITEGEWFADALDDDGDLTPDTANEMAEIITNDGILPGRAMKAVEAAKAWQESEQETNRLALARAVAVAEVVAYIGGNQTAAGHLLGIDQSTVNRLVKKARAAKEAPPLCGRFSA